MEEAMSASSGTPTCLSLLLGAALLSACDGAPSAAPAENAANATEPIAAPAAEPNDTGSANASAPAPAPAPDAPAEPAPPPAQASAWSKSGYSLSGTEPFWGGTVTPTRIVYMTPEEQKGEKVAVTAA
jgi:hypothetical protein